MDTQAYKPRLSALEFLPRGARDGVGRDPRLTMLFASMAELSCREAPSLEQAADVLHCRSITLRRRLARAGLSWREFVADWRLEQARILRRATGDPLKAIAPRVGYASVATLSRALRRRRPTGASGALPRSAGASYEGDR